MCTLDLGLAELHNLQLVFSTSFSIIYIYINIYDGEMFYSFSVIYHVGNFLLFFYNIIII